MNFRRTILAMALLALCCGLASAQVIIGPIGNAIGGPITCTANVAVPNQLRSEGMTELIGDIVLQCIGGTPAAQGSIVPTANFTVSLATNVTSRLVNCSTGAGNCSDAILLIDEPNTAGSAGAGTGAGPLAGFTPCTNPVGAGPGGCQQVVSNQTTTGPAAGQSASSCSGTTGGCTAAANVFTGVVNANQVIFNGIPVNPPATGGVARIFRITNVRANVSSLGGGGLAGTTQLLASISISGSTSLLVANPVQIAGFIQSGLSTSLRNVQNSGGGGNTALAQCGGGGPNALSILRFSENFATAFKIRTQPSQNVPGTIYNSESGLQITTPPMPANTGLADFGTRLKAVFNNVPAGVRLFVSTTNVINDFQLGPILPSGTNSAAALVASETGAFAAQPGNTNITIGNTIITGGLAEIPVVNGTATAVWEVLSTNPAAIEGQTTSNPGSTVGQSNPGTFDFAVYQQFTANPGANSPPVGQATVNMSYAPTPPVAFSAAAGAVASSSLPIPRFADTSSATNILSIVLCNTVLLFPFVTNQSGFDTGLAISNTTTDPFSTRPQSGTCTLNFFGASAPPAVTTANVPTGTTFVTLASTSAAGFQGYMIAVCQFQLAHGFAFISDIGARNLAMGYLALVLPDGTGSRNNRTEQLNN